MLTAKETEILNLIKLGYMDKNITHVLSISKWTVKYHVSRILEDLEVDSRAHAVYIAMKRGIIE